MGVRSGQVSSVAQSCPTLCNSMDLSTPGFPVHHQLPELTQTHAHGAGDAIQPPHSLSSPSPSFRVFLVPVKRGGRKAGWCPPPVSTREITGGQKSLGGGPAPGPFPLPLTPRPGVPAGRRSSPLSSLQELRTLVWEVSAPGPAFAGRVNPQDTSPHWGGLCSHTQVTQRALQSCGGGRGHGIHFNAERVASKLTDVMAALWDGPRIPTLQVTQQRGQDGNPSAG